MKKAVILIDGAYLEKYVEREYPGKQMNVSGLITRLAYNTANGFNDSYEVIRTYYYDAVPEEVNGLPNSILQKVREKRRQKMQFLDFLTDNCTKLEVKKGLVKVKGNGELEQKGVDVYLGSDMALIANSGRVDAIILITGDADFIPAVAVAKAAMVNVYLISDSQGLSKLLKGAVDWANTDLQQLVEGSTHLGANLIHDAGSSGTPDSIPVNLSPLY